MPRCGRQRAHISHRLYPSSRGPRPRGFYKGSTMAWGVDVAQSLGVSWFIAMVSLRTLHKNDNNRIRS